MLFGYELRWSDGTHTRTYSQLADLMAYLREHNMRQDLVKRGKFVVSCGPYVLTMKGKRLYKAQQWQQSGASDAAIFAQLDGRRVREAQGETK